MDELEVCWKSVHQTAVLTIFNPSACQVEY